MKPKLKFKVGDKVRVKSLEWYNSEKNDNGDILKGYKFTKKMSKFCGNILTIRKVYNCFYFVYENNNYWEDWMLEDEVITEEEQQEKK
jgi:hypothetical protein